MYRTTEEALKAAHQTLLLKQQANGRRVSPWVQRAVLRTLPAKETTR